MQEVMMPSTLVLAVALLLAAESGACLTKWNITLETFGEGVMVELRSGAPGSSHVIGTRTSSGGQVQFGGLCAGSYFLAIGNGDIVSVTPVRNFENNRTYLSKITVTLGSGNVSRRSRKSL
jgi:hypothetical protein